jgi:UDP-N-acetylmuramyl pentapeptide phosphotransferase/UDP-N-acetylglucosamine-1-phosphate transferase
MLGDTGSNLLGGLLGLGLVLAVHSLIGRVVILLCLLALHFLAERVSLTRVIEQNPILRKLDALTGVR